VKLPEIDYGGQVQDSSRTAAMPGEAAQGLSKVISDGLTAYAQEWVKTQHQEGAIRLGETLNSIENTIKAKRELSQDEVKQAFGEDVPPQIATIMGKRDALTGDLLPIPMWAVGDAIYAKAAKKAVADVTGGLEVTGGWAQDFRARAEEHVVQRRQGLAEHHLRAFDSYLQHTQLQQVERLRNAGLFEQADEANVTALPFEVRQVERQKTEAARQLQPALDAQASPDLKVIEEQIVRLKTSPAAIAAIPDSVRRTNIAHLEERAVKYEAVGAANEAWAAGVTPDSRVFDEQKMLSALDAKVKGRKPEMQKAARDFLKARITDANEERKNETAKQFAIALQAVLAPGSDGKPNLKTSSVPPAQRAYLTDPANGKEAADLWASLRDKERSAEMHDRSLAEKPTEANWRAYGKVVKDMQDNPTKYRAMDGDRFVSEVYGTVGPLVSQAMTLYRSVTEPKPDPRHLSADELKAAWEMAPKRLKVPSKLKDPDSTHGKVSAEMQRRLGERKEKEWAGKPGPVPQALMKEWASEEFAKGTVPGGWLQNLWPDETTKLESEVKGRGAEFTPAKPPAGPPRLPPVPQSDTVLVEHNGRRLRIPRARLDDAKKDGAVEAK